ncbi:MAG: hypothetical protein HYY84_05420 [Deltaproteobacteria bacterium]|nr:hypothetical protein [Deltaproteobacteria bacterium]
MAVVACAACFACGSSKSSGRSGCDDPAKCTDAGTVDASVDPCTNDPQKCVDGGDAGQTFDESPVVLSWTPVDLSGTYDAGSKRLGALVCDPTTPAGQDAVYGMFCFHPFGIMVDWIPGHLTMRNPTFDYVIPLNEPVRAVTAGRVRSLTLKTESWVGPNEYGLLLEPRPHSAYQIEYDHLKDPVVAIGAMVDAGDTLGTGGRCQGCDLAYAFIEVGVHYHLGATDGSASNRCPTTYGTAEFVERHQVAADTQKAVFPSSKWNADSPCVVQETK